SGRSPDDARIIADGSWSVDMNKDTVAFRLRDIPSYLIDQARVNMRFDDPQYGLRVLNPTNTRPLDQLLPPGGELYRLGTSGAYHPLYLDPARSKDGPNSPSLNPVYQRWYTEQAARLDRNPTLSADDRRTAKLLMESQYYHQLLDSFVHPTNL